MTIQGGIVEYVLPGETMTMTAGAAITGGNAVKLTGNRTVVKTAAAAEPTVIGVALYNTTASGDIVTVAAEGVWPLVASGNIATGDQVYGAAAGAVTTIPAADATSLATLATSIGNLRAAIGQALEAIAGAATGRIKVQK